MARLSDLPLSLRLFLKAYRWRRIDPVPWTALTKPLAQARVALISSAGFVGEGQGAFDESVRGGDWSFRLLDRETDPATLRDAHRSESFDHAGIRQDPNLAFPIDRMRELEAAGTIGSLSPRLVSVMGSITAPARLMSETAPLIAAALREDRADAAILIPV